MEYKVKPPAGTGWSHSPSVEDDFPGGVPSAIVASLRKVACDCLIGRHPHIGETKGEELGESFDLRVTDLPWGLLPCSTALVGGV